MSRSDHIDLWRFWIAAKARNSIEKWGYTHLDLKLIQDRQGKFIFDIDQFAETLGCKVDHVGMMLCTISPSKK
tara:strand:- start:10408 stop:10626 length:219 start_codon:yes stop_codon:yes gene_type:complete